eukprot:gene10214-21292_t
MLETYNISDINLVGNVAKKAMLSSHLINLKSHDELFNAVMETLANESNEDEDLSEDGSHSMHLSDHSVGSETSGCSSSSLPDSFGDIEAGELGLGTGHVFLPGVKDRFTLSQPTRNIINASNNTRQICQQIESKYKLEVDRLQSLLKNQKESLRDLHISQSTYNALIGVPEEELSLRDFAALRAEEMVQMFRLEAQQTSSALQNTQRTLAENSGVLKLQAAELERLRTHSEMLEESHRRECLTMAERVQRLERDHNSERTLRMEFEEKAVKYDVMAEEVDVYRKKCGDLGQMVQSQSTLITALQSSDAEHRQLLTDTQRQLEMRRLDLTYLQAELRDARTRADDRARALEGSSGKILTLENKISEMGDLLLAQQMTARADFDSRLEKEITRLREEGRIEIDRNKDTMREMADREIRVLRELKASLETDLEAQKRKAEKLGAELAQHTADSANKLALRDQEVSGLRTELKLRSFELSSLGIERAALIRQHVLEIDRLREEHSAYRAALDRLEQEHSRERGGLEAQILSAHARLKVLEHNATMGSATGMGASSSQASRDTVAADRDQLVQTQMAMQRAEANANRLRRELEEIRELLALPSLQGGSGGLNEGVRVYLTGKLRLAEKQTVDAMARAEAAEKREALMEERLGSALQRAAEEAHAAAAARERLETLLRERTEVEDLRGILSAYWEEEEGALTEFEQDDPIEEAVYSRTTEGHATLPVLDFDRLREGRPSSSHPADNESEDTGRREHEGGALTTSTDSLAAAFGLSASQLQHLVVRRGDGRGRRLSPG